MDPRAAVSSLRKRYRLGGSLRSMKANQFFDYLTAINDQLTDKRIIKRKKALTLSLFQLKKPIAIFCPHVMRYKDAVKLHNCWFLHNRPFKRKFVAPRRINYPNTLASISGTL